MSYKTTLPHPGSSPTLTIVETRPDAGRTSFSSPGFLKRNRGVVTASGELVLRLPKIISSTMRGRDAAGGKALLIIDAAEQRLVQIEADVRQPSFFEDDAPQVLLSDTAIQRARQVVRSLTVFDLRPTCHIGIFAMENGGLQLQSIGVNSAVSIEIPPNPAEPMLGEFASADEYRSRSMQDSIAAAQFLASAPR